MATDPDAKGHTVWDSTTANVQSRRTKGRKGLLGAGDRGGEVVTHGMSDMVALESHDVST